MHFILYLYSCSSKHSTENFTPPSHKNQTQGSHLPWLSPFFPPPYLDLSKEKQLLLLSAEKRQDKREQKQAADTAKWSPFVQNPHQSDHSLQELKREPQVFIKPVCEARAASTDTDILVFSESIHKCGITTAAELLSPLCPPSEFFLAWFLY